MAEVFGWFWLWVVVVGLAAVGLPLLTVMAALLERSGPVRLRHWAEEAGGSLRVAYEQPARFAGFRFVLSLGAKLAPAVLLIGLAGFSFSAGTSAVAAFAAGLAIAAATAAASELLARQVVDRHSETSLGRLTGAYRGAWLVLGPLARVASMWLRGDSVPEAPTEDEASDGEIEAFIDFGTREGILEPEAGEMVWGIVDLGETEVKSVMTPRIDIASAPAGEGLEALAERFLESGHSRLPLYEGSIDRVVGVLHIRDVLRGLREADPPPALALAKSPLMVPETKRLDELLKEMQAGQQQLAVVIDEYGGTSGLVSLEDLVEEIVGEIADEHEVVEPEPQQLADGAWRLDGRTPIQELEELCGVELADASFETVGGLVLAAVGSVPESGDEVRTNGLLLTVEQVEKRRILEVRVETVPDDEPAALAPEEALGE